MSLNCCESGVASIWLVLSFDIAWSHRSFPSSLTRKAPSGFGMSVEAEMRSPALQKSTMSFKSVLDVCCIS